MNAENRDRLNILFTNLGYPKGIEGIEAMEIMRVLQSTEAGLGIPLGADLMFIQLEASLIIKTLALETLKT